MTKTLAERAAEVAELFIGIDPDKWKMPVDHFPDYKSWLFTNYAPAMAQLIADQQAYIKQVDEILDSAHQTSHAMGKRLQEKDAELYLSNEAIRQSREVLKQYGFADLPFLDDGIHAALSKQQKRIEELLAECIVWEIVAEEWRDKYHSITDNTIIEEQ